MLDVLFLTFVFFLKRQVAVVTSDSHRFDCPSLLIWEDDYSSSRSRLEVINEHLAMFKALGAISDVNSNFSTMTRNFAPSLATTRRTVAVPIPSTLACWHMNVLVLLRMASGKLSLSTAVFRPLSASLLTAFTIIHALLNRVDECARHPDKVCDLTHFSTRSVESFTRLYLCWVILKYTTMTNLFLRCHSHRASGGLSKTG